MPRSRKSKEDKSQEKKEDKVEKVVIRSGDLHKIRSGVEQLMTQALAVDLSYRLMRLSKVLREETAQFDKVKLELAEKYGKLNEETKQYLIEEGDPNKEKFLEEFEKLCETKISLGEFQKIKKQELGGIRITGLTLVNLEALLAAD